MKSTTDMNVYKSSTLYALLERLHLQRLIRDGLAESSDELELQRLNDLISISYKSFDGLRPSTKQLYYLYSFWKTNDKSLKFISDIYNYTIYFIRKDDPLSMSDVALILDNLVQTKSFNRRHKK